VASGGVNVADSQQHRLSSSGSILQSDSASAIGTAAPAAKPSTAAPTMPPPYSAQQSTATAVKLSASPSRQAASSTESASSAISPLQPVIKPTLAAQPPSPTKSSYASVAAATSPPPQAAAQSQQQLEQTTSEELVEAREQVKNLQSMLEKYQRELSSVKSELRQRPSASNTTSATGTSPAPGLSEAKPRRSSKPSVQTIVQEQEHLYPVTVLLLVAIVAFLFGVLFF
jgi:hypothetical protein